MFKPMIAVVAFNEISPFHLSVPSIVFGKDRLHPSMPEFDVVTCSAEQGVLSTNAGFALKTAHSLKVLEQADIIIVPSWRDPDERPPQTLINALRKAHKKGSKIVGLCLGSFVLAATGLLDGRSATTHWGWVNQLQQCYPQINVQPDVLYVDEGDILTSAGVAAGIDCCLHIIRTLYGSEVANCVARRLVVPPHRQGGQAQYIEQPVYSSANTDYFSQVLADVQANLKLSYSLDDLAQRSLMSRSTFTRRFKRVMGSTFWQWLLRQRLALAQRLLETTDKPIELIADEVGFHSALSLRKHFATQLKTSPRRYRNEFRHHQSE